jgi:glycosyltransferase involved in cell wall biosynthesis
MRIAIISSLFPPFAIGGAEQVASQLALALHRLGHHIDVISTCRRDQLGSGRYRTDEWEGIQVWRIAPLNLYWRFDKEAGHPNRLVRAGWHTVDLWNPSILGPLRQVLDHVQPDVINTHNIDGLSPAVWRVARNRTGAIVHTLHDYHLVCPRATMQRRDGTICEELCRFCRLYARYHRLFQRSVRVLVAPTSSIAGLHREAGWTEPTIEIIRNGVDVDAIRLPDVSPSDPLRVLFMSRLEREKGCEMLLAVMSSLRECAGVQFHVAGRGNYEGRFSDLARRSANVVWHGFVTGAQKLELLSMSDVFLQISQCRENAPLSLLEAKKCGLYVVGTRVGGIPEDIDSAEAGQLIPPGDTEQLSKTLRMLAETRQALRDGRPQRLRQNTAYGTREMAEAYLKVFQSILECPRPAVRGRLQ